LTSRLERTVVSDKMINDHLSRVEESATKSTYKLGVGFERCEDKGEKSATEFISSSTYHKEEATIKPTKAHYPSNPKPSFNQKREARKETPKQREKAFVCIFCGCARELRETHLDEFCFQRKRIEKRRFDYARNSYRDEFIDFPPRSYSRALPRTYSCALHHFSHGPNHRSYGFGGHLSFDLLCQLNGLGLLRGLPLLKFESDHVCAPCRHGKMNAASHSPVNIAMTEQLRQLLHLDTIGPSRVHSMGGKWYVLVILDDYSRYSWVFFLESKYKVFEHFQSLALRLNNEHHNCLKAIPSDNGAGFRNNSFD
jgi:hypothetical protein